MFSRARLYYRTCWEHCCTRSCSQTNQGIEDREVFKREGTSQDDVLDTIKHHLYVCTADSPALKRHLITRDYLRNNEWAKIEYQQMKYALAEKAGQEQKAYADLKEKHVNELIDRFYIFNA